MDALTPAGRLFGLLAMNTACPRRVSLIPALGLPTILSPTISATTGDRPVASGGLPPRQASPFARRLARPCRPNRVHDGPFQEACVTDWSFSRHCSLPRLTATRLCFDTPQLIAAGEWTFHHSGPVPFQAHERGRLARLGCSTTHRFGPPSELDRPKRPRCHANRRRLLMHKCSGGRKRLHKKGRLRAANTAWSEPWWLAQPCDQRT